MAGIRMENKIYEVGMYCRLSKDDGTDNESASIATQKSILTDYVKKQGVKWLAGFRDKQATFTGVWEQSFTLSDALVAAGVMDPADIAHQRNIVLCKKRLSQGTLAAAFGDSALY